MISESDLKVEQNEVPGTYVFNQRENGTSWCYAIMHLPAVSCLPRNATSTAGTWRLWNMRKRPPLGIEFEATTPSVLSRHSPLTPFWCEGAERLHFAPVTSHTSAASGGAQGSAFGGDAPAYFCKQQ